MVGGNGISNILHQDSLTCLWLSHNQCTLTFTDRREEVYNTNTGVRGSLIATKGKFLFWEEWGKVLESHTVANFWRLTSVDALNGGKGKVLLILVRWTNAALYHVTRLQTILLNLLWWNINIVGRWQIVVVWATQETVTISKTLEYAIAFDDVSKVVFGCSLWASSDLLRHILLNHRTIEHVECWNSTLVFYGDIENGNEIGTITWISQPNTILIHFATTLVLRLVLWLWCRCWFCFLMISHHLFAQLLDSVYFHVVSLELICHLLWYQEFWYVICGWFSCLFSGFCSFLCFYLSLCAATSALGLLLFSWCCFGWRLFGYWHVAKKWGCLYFLPTIGLTIQIFAVFTFYGVDFARVFFSNTCAFALGSFISSTVLGSLVENGVDDVFHLIVGGYFNSQLICYTH